MISYSSGETISSFPHIKGITLAAGEGIYEVAGRASGMGLDGIGKLMQQVKIINFLMSFS